MTQQLISVIIPVYNLEEYIVRTLNSVFSQTYSNIEVVAVDDGSTDKSPSLLDDYAEKESRLKVIHKQNEGVSKARMAGVAAAAGDYIGFVDGDDLIDPDMYERLLNNAVKYKADISHCGYRLIRPDGSVVFFYNTGEIILQNNEQGIFDLLSGSKIEPGLCNKLFRATLFHSLLHSPSINLSFKENEDLLMNYCLFKMSSKSVYEDFCPYCYIIRVGSSSHGKTKEHMLTDPIKIGEILLKDTENNINLYRQSSRYYVTKLIKAITFNYNNTEIDASLKNESRRKLKGFLKKYFKTEEKQLKKYLALLACFFPRIYNFLHKLYLSGR